MLRRVTPCALVLVMTLMSGCGPSVRESSVGIFPQIAMHDEALAGEDVTPLPVEYVWTGGVQVVGSAISFDVDTERMLLKGRLRAETFTGFRPSRVVRVEALDGAHHLLWSGTAKLKRTRGTVRHRSRTGTFQFIVPDLTEVDHLHMGVVSRRDSADMLPATCLHNNS